jgi:hypothetical protein
MRRIQQTTILPCSPRRFWSVLLDPTYARALLLDGLGFAGVDVLESTEVVRKLRIVPRMNLPAVLERIVGDAFAYEEHGLLDREKNEWSWRMVHPASSRLPELIATKGTVKLVDRGSEESERQEEIVFEGKLFGLGGVIEGAAEKEARSAWGKELPFLEEWLKKPPSGS